MIYKLTLQNDVDGMTRRTWTFRPPVIVGRDPASDVCIDHHSISRQHCQFTLNGDEALVVRDLHSTNGVYVDDQRVTRQRVLMPNQVLQIGGLEMRVQFSNEDEHRATKDEPSGGNVDTTQPMPIFEIDPPAEEKPWWKKIIG